MEYLIPSRRTRPGDDPIFALHAEAEKRIAAGERILDATIGALLDDEGKLCVLPSVVQAIHDVPTEVAVAYAPIAGRDDFRAAVARDLLGPTGLDSVVATVATPGATGALRIAVDNFLEPGQTMLTSSYYWGPYRTLGNESGRSLATYRMFDAEGRLDVADLDRKLSSMVTAQGRAFVILNTPCNNPTGYSLDDREWDGVAQVVREHSRHAPVVVVLDIAYGYYDAAGMACCMRGTAKLADCALVVYAWSASKSFVQYGLRVGALVAVVPDAKERAVVQNSITHSCRGLWSNCNAAGMAAIGRALTEPDLRQRCIAERDELVGLLARRVARWNELARGAGLRFPRYDGGFFTTVFCDDAEGVAARLRAKGIYLVPHQGALRIAICAVGQPVIEQIVPAIAAELA